MFIVYVTFLKLKNKFTTCLDHNVVRSIAVAASVKLLLDGNLISLKCNLVDPLCERGTIVALNAKSVGLYPSGLSDDAEAEFFLDDVTVEGPAGVFRFEVLITPVEALKVVFSLP